MASRYQEVYRLNQKLYLDGSPVIIEAGALQNDLVQNKILAQIKMRNISSKNIIACKVVIWAYEVNGNEVEGISGFSYLDINVATGEDFGTKTPVYMPDNNTRQFTVAVIEVVFSDRSIWKSDQSEWFEIPAQPRIIDLYHDYEMARQYEIEVGGNCKAVPMLIGGLFLCTCGTENMQVAGTCYKCHRSYNDLLAKLDVSYLQEKIDDKKKKEEEKKAAELAAKKAAEIAEAERQKIAKQKAEQERIKAKERKEKNKKKIIILTSIIVVLVLVYVIVTQYQQKAIEATYAKAAYFESQKMYIEAKAEYDKILDFQDSRIKSDFCEKESILNNAIEKYNMGEFEEALNILDTIKGHTGVNDWIYETKYSYAIQLYNKESYNLANIMFMELEIVPYKDASDWVIESSYMIAKEEYDSKCYYEAYSGFKLLDDYKDSYEMMAKSLYLYAEDCMTNNKFKDACDTYYNSLLKGYEDSDSKYVEAAYLYAKECYEASNFSDASTYFWKASGYEDADEMLIASRYEEAMTNLENEDYRSAADKLELVGDYKDSKSKLKEAKYLYVQAHMDGENATTYNYLIDLKAENYLDSKELYSSIFDYRLVCFAINNSEFNETTYSTSLSKYDKWYFHFRIEGGPPTQTAEKFYYRLSYPDGSLSKKDELGSWVVGNNTWVNSWWDPPSSCPKGKLSLTVYDSKNNAIGTVSVDIN